MERGAALENAAGAQMTLVRPDADGNVTEYISAPWSVAISQEDANAWLAGRLPTWLHSRGAQMPAGLGTVCVQFENGRVRLLAPVPTPAGTSIVSIPVEFATDSDGGLVIMLGTAWAGYMPIPGAGLGIAAALRRTVDQSDASGEEIIIKHPVLDVDDGRVVRIITVVPRSGRLELTLETRSK